MHDDQRRQLAALVEQAREDLLRIGRALIDDESVKVSNLVGELNEIQEMVDDIGNPYLGFCSQSGRLGGVMFVMGEIGAAIFELARTEAAKSDRQLRLELQGYVHEFGRTGKRLLRISETDVVFIVGDARVLHDHPDLAQADEVREALGGGDRLPGRAVGSLVVDGRGSPKNGCRLRSGVGRPFVPANDQLTRCVPSPALLATVRSTSRFT
ncbi:hypothetical protein ACU4HD_14115 [Cupriavidus basilensis]